VARPDKKATRSDGLKVTAFEHGLLHGRSNGNAGVTPRFREASQSHASNSPVPGEGRSPNSLADEEGARLRWAARADDEPTATEGGDPTTSLNRRAIISIAAMGCFVTNYADIKRKKMTT
jgi:hypothetical protein